MKSIIYTTVRSEIEHDEPFDNSHAVLEYAQELLDYANLPLGESTDGRCRLVSIEIVDDDVAEYNNPTDEE